jgi:excinuclease ABC subunit C
VLKELESKMAEASRKLEFERAAALRDQLEAVRSVAESQRIATAAQIDQDVIALVQNRDYAYAEVFFIRKGKLIERDHFILQGAQDEQPSQIMTSFLHLFYDSATYIPPLVLLQQVPEDKAVLEQWLASKRGTKVVLQTPLRGNKRKLVDLVAENARQGLSHMMIKWLADPQASAATLEELRSELGLPRTPKRMECYDISDIRGTSAVGSMVVFEDGKPKPAHYRRFKIKLVGGSDDYAMMQEVLRRRFKRGSQNGSAWARTPDLVLIDGGRGHLNAALAAMKEAGADSIPVASIAKEREEIFRPDIPEPIVLSRTSHALYLVQRIRDEAHRFALGYHHRLHTAKALTSALDNVPGIGPKRKKALLKKFGSLKAIKEAPLDEVAALPGMTRSLAQRVKEYL